MKRILFAAAIAVGVLALVGGESAASDHSGFPPPGVSPAPAFGYPYGPPSDNGHGVNPLFRRFFGGKSSKCNDCAPVAPPPGLGYPGTPGSQMPGTLVFPMNPFIRSPRDFFMYESGK